MRHLNTTRMLAIVLVTVFLSGCSEAVKQLTGEPLSQEPAASELTEAPTETQTATSLLATPTITPTARPMPAPPLITVGDSLVLTGWPDDAPPGLIFTRWNEATMGLDFTFDLWIVKAGGVIRHFAEGPRDEGAGDTPDRGRGYDVSPDGSQMLYAYHNDIWRLDTASGAAENLTNTPERVEGTPQWWPDPQARGFFCMSWKPDDWPGHLEYGYPTFVGFDGTYEVLEEDFTSTISPAISPDGQTVVYADDNPDYAVWLLRVGGGREQLDLAAYGSDLRVGDMSWSPDGHILSISGWLPETPQCRDNYSCPAAIDLLDLDIGTSQVAVPGFLPLETDMPLRGTAPYWSSSGDWFIFSPSVESLWFYAGGEARQIANYDQLGFETRVISPDDHWIALSTVNERDLALVRIGAWSARLWNLPDYVWVDGWIAP